MNKILTISTILMFCLSFLVVAGPDLSVGDLVIDNNESIIPGEKYHYTVDIKNVGDEDSYTRLPYFAYVDEEYKGLYPGSLTTTLSDRKMEDVSTITIINADGSETETTPEFGETSYIAHPESEEQIQKRIDGMMERANSLGWSEEQIQTETAEIQQKYSQPHEKRAEGAFITIEPGQTVRYDSADSFKEFGALSFPTTSLSVDPIPIILTFEIDPFLESDENVNNNVYTKEITMEANVIQGPKEATKKNKELDDENEYFAYALGCTIIQSKEICVSGDDPNIPDEEENLIISVDGVEQEYSLYGLMMSWLYSWFGDGKLAPTETVNGVEVTLYDNGFKFIFV
jgi:hypothetical protein